MGSYYMKHEATCPKCNAAAVFEESGGSGGDEVEGICKSCGNRERSRLEESDGLYGRWQCKLWFPGEDGDDGPQNDQVWILAQCPNCDTMFLTEEHQSAQCANCKESFDPEANLA